MKYVRELEGLRGVMALWVVVGHWSTTATLPHWIAKTKLYNGYAVDVFVILSGFAIAALLDKRTMPYKDYIVGRFLRIFPVYLFFLALAALAAPLILEMWQASPPGYMRETRIQIAADTVEFFGPHLLAHVTALHGLVPPVLLPNTDFAILGVAWSISLEWQFYLVAPFLIAALGRRVDTAFVCGAIAVALAMLVSFKFMPSGFLGRHLPNFLIGIGSFAFLKNRFNGAPGLQFPVVPVWLATVVVCIYLSSMAALPYFIWVSIMVVVVNAHENTGKLAPFISRLLTGNLAQKTGHMAYSIYLSHMLILMACVYFLEQAGYPRGMAYDAVLLGALVAGTLVVSLVTYRLIELPFHNWGKRLVRESALRGAVNQA